MATYNSIEEFYEKALVQEIKEALEKVAIEIQQTIRLNILTEIYGSFTPEVYKRTYELLNSVWINPVVKDSNNFYIEIEIPNDVLHSNPRIFPNPDIGVAVGEHPSLAKVAEIFATGVAYGRGGKNIDVIKDTEDEYIETGKALKLVINELKKKFDVIA